MKRDYKITVPKGKSGDWAVERFRINKKDADFHNLRCAINGIYHRRVEAGHYTRLIRGNEVIMSDTQAEYNDHWEIIHEAKGHILVHGLGLGLVIQECLKKPGVEFATVIELSEDVISLVSKHYMKMFPNKLKIIQADALEWKPPKGIRYGAVWHDIWDNICEDNLEQMKFLHRRYGRRCEWQGSWGRDEINRMRRW